MNKIFFTSLIVLLSVSISFSQNIGQKGDTLINYKDINGLKQGKWSKNYKNGRLAYTANFKNDKLIGLYQRFHSTKKLALDITYDEKESGYAKMYYDNGKLEAEGKYIDRNVKDGLWKFYATDGALVLEINYSAGKLNGNETKYWRNGNRMELKTWINDKLDGVWSRYFEDGTMRMQIQYKNNIRTGKIQLFYPNGRMSIDGSYANNLRTGHWMFYEQDGKVRRDTDYIKGVATDQAEVDAKTTKMLEEWENMEGVIPNPNTENMFKYDREYGPKSK